MVYGFDEYKGKVDIDAILDELETNYQGNIDTLYNAIVAEGVTPASKSPADIAASITDVYDTGYNAAQSITWSQTLSMALYGYTSGFITNSGAGYSLKNVNSFTVNAVGGAVDVTIGDATTTVNAGSSRTFSSFNDTTVYFDGPKGSGNYTNVTVTFNYQAKILR